MSSYSLTWHRDHAAESIKGKELNRWSRDPSFEWIMYAVECLQVADLAAQIEIAHIAAIATTVKATIVEVARGGTPRTRSRKKITDKQRYVLAVALAEKYGNARGVAAAVWNLTDEEIDQADV